jgi:hypothetical protein
MRIECARQANCSRDMPETPTVAAATKVYFFSVSRAMAMAMWIPHSNTSPLSGIPAN